MAAREAKMTVHGTDEDGTPFTYYEGQAVPEEHARLVKNERVFGGNGRTDSGGEGSDADEGKRTGTEYDDMKVPELLQMSQDRGLELPSSAKKAELIAALKEDDEKDS